MVAPLFEKFISILTTLPGIGRKSAHRIAFHLLRMETGSYEQLLQNLKNIKESIRFCKICAGITEHEVCEICNSDERDGSILCIIEQPEDIFFIENTGEYKGKYHVLNGVLSPLDGIGPEELRIKELIGRLSDLQVKEIILATNPTIEGDATASYLQSIIKDFNLKTTRIAYGVSIGSTLEYADRYTLGRAIKSRLTI